MKLIIETAETMIQERDYILSVIFDEFLGIPWCRINSNKNDISIKMQGHSGNIYTPDIFFRTDGEQWLTIKNLPIQPLSVWDSTGLGLRANLIDRYLPIIYGNIDFPYTNGLRNVEKKQRYLPIDIFGSAFFMLTRYEETVKDELDLHGRFMGRSSLAYQEGFLERPIIDEYIEVLWAVMKSLWPGLTRKNQNYQFKPTHDLDRPFLFKDIKTYSYGIFSHIYHLRFRLLFEWLALGILKLNEESNDPFIKAQYHLLSMSEKYGLKSCINLMGALPGTKDFGYNLNNPVIHNLVKHAINRGHSIGYHPGYSTYCNAELFKNEKDRIENTFNIELSQGRQHYLRVKYPETWQIWDDAGFMLHGTSGYSDCNGFRCGVCRSYTVYDLLKKRKLKLKEQPLILMDGALKSKENENLSINEAINRCLYFGNVCRKFHGEFVVLWHNSSLHGDWRNWRPVYYELMKNAA